MRAGVELMWKASVESAWFFCPSRNKNVGDDFGRQKAYLTVLAEDEELWNASFCCEAQFKQLFFYSKLPGFFGIDDTVSELDYFPKFIYEWSTGFWRTHIHIAFEFDGLEISGGDVDRRDEKWKNVARERSIRMQRNFSVDESGRIDSFFHISVTLTVSRWGTTYHWSLSLSSWSCFFILKNWCELMMLSFRPEDSVLLSPHIEMLTS